MELKLNTPLKIDEIDFRVQSVNKGGYATILAYKDARVDMNRLDAVIGFEYWQKKYELIDNHLFCSIGIFNKTINQWIWKQDVGTESNTEKEKGEASDAFKRACFNLGIGRELYDYPLIQVKLNANEFKIENYQGKEVVKTTFDFKLKEWIWESEFDENGKLILLIAKDNLNKIRFEYNLKKPVVKEDTSSLTQQIENAKAKIVTANSLEDLKKKYEGLTKVEKNFKEVIELKDKLKSTFSNE